MDVTIPGPLDGLEEPQLYRMLGEAWYTQFRRISGQCYYLEPPEEIGRREYESLLPKLREDLHRPCRNGVVACAMSTIQRSISWRMPATVVAALAKRQGLVQPQSLAAAAE